MKDNFFTILVLVVGLLGIGCSSKQQSSKAIIIERKINHDSLLTITYSYSVKGKSFTDSIKLKNKVISSDTLSLFFSEENPQIHSLQLP